MTEEEWLACEDPKPLLEFLKGRTSDRKLRLFAVACCRRIWLWLMHNDSFRSIEIAERYVEGEATDEELRIAEELAMWAGDDASWSSMQEAANAWAAAAPVQKNGFSSAVSAVYEVQRVFPENEPKYEEERLAQTNLLRDIVGNPFRPISIDTTWLTPTVNNLATIAYEERALPSGVVIGMQKGPTLGDQIGK